MLNMQLQKQFMFIIFIGGFLSVAILMILVPLFDATDSAISFVLSEFFILITMIITVRKKGIRILAA